MSTLTTERLATLPRVNLLPPEIQQARRFRRVQLGLGVGVLASVVVAGVLFAAADHQVAAAQTELDTSTARAAALQTRVATYAEVPLVNAQVEAARAQLGQAMGQEVRWSYYLNDLSLTIPSRVWLTSMTATTTAPQAAAATGDTQYLSTGIGNIAFEGRGYRHNDVAAWLNSLARQKGYTQPYFTNSTVNPVGGNEDAVTFTSQVTVTEDALSKRYTVEAGN